MSRKDHIEEKAWEMLNEVTDSLSLRPVDAEYVKEGGEYYLRLFIDGDGGVTIEDCEAVSRRMDPLLDEQDLIEDAYTLEVSSPGLGRLLRRPHDFAYALQKEVELKTFKAVDGTKSLRGVLTGFDDRTVTVETGDVERTFSKKDLAQIRLALDL